MKKPTQFCCAVLIAGLTFAAPGAALAVDPDVDIVCNEVEEGDEDSIVCKAPDEIKAECEFMETPPGQIPLCDTVSEGKRTKDPRGKLIGNTIPLNAMPLKKMFAPRGDA